MVGVPETGQGTGKHTGTTAEATAATTNTYVKMCEGGG